jgi:hypothetical protein
MGSLWSLASITFPFFSLLIPFTYGFIFWGAIVGASGSLEQFRKGWVGAVRRNKGLFIGYARAPKCAAVCEEKQDLRARAQASRSPCPAFPRRLVNVRGCAILTLGRGREAHVQMRFHGLAPFFRVAGPVGMMARGHPRFFV